MLKCGMGIFFTSNTYIMLINIVIRVKRSLITENKMFHDLIFFKLLLYIKKIVYTFACPPQLLPERIVASRVSLSSIFSGCAKLLLMESGFPDMFLVTIYLDIARFFTNMLDRLFSCFFFIKILLYRKKQPSSLNFFCHVQICIAVGNCF